MIPFRLPAALLIAAFALSACETRTGLSAPPPALAQNFRLGHAVVVAETATKAPISRDASQAQLETAVTKAVKERFSRLEGSAFYHLGINVDGYALAPPGVPLLVSPKSVLIISVTLMTDTDGGKKVNPEPEQLTVFETLSAGTAIGSGLTRSADEQLENLSFNAALAIEDWLAKNPQFFDPTAVSTPRTGGAAAR